MGRFRLQQILLPIRHLAGLGHFIHTYVRDETLPTFCGPERVEIPDDIDAFTAEIWGNLDADNKISLYVRYGFETGNTKQNDQQKT